MDRIKYELVGSYKRRARLVKDVLPTSFAHRLPIHRPEAPGQTTRSRMPEFKLTSSRAPGAASTIERFRLSFVNDAADPATAAFQRTIFTRCA
jgi:hypothetical protein